MPARQTQRPEYVCRDKAHRGQLEIWPDAHPWPTVARPLRSVESAPDRLRHRWSATQRLRRPELSWQFPVYVAAPPSKRSRGAQTLARSKPWHDRSPGTSETWHDRSRDTSEILARVKPGKPKALARAKP